MKSTPILKRIFASAFTAVSLATLATISLTQSTFAAVNENLLTDMDPVHVTAENPEDTISNGKITTTSATAKYSAIYNEKATIGTIDNVKIDLSGDSWARGIYNYNGSSISSISNVDITVSASSEAYGIASSSSDIESITGADIKVNSESGKSYGVHLLNSASIASFSGNITATTASGTATALYIATGDTFTFNDDSSLTATATGDAGTAYAIQITYVSSYSLKATSSDTKITLNGDIMSESTALTVDSGNYVLDGDITASSLSINEGATLTLTGETAFALADGTLTLNVDTLTEAAMLVITEGASIEGLTDIYVVLSGDAAASTWDDAELTSIISDEGSALSGVNYSVYSGSTDTEAISAGTFGSTTIPEPSTATLSLLALAGLCIRRRRKAA